MYKRQALSIQALQMAIDPVSYTHLDVYKRQLAGRAVEVGAFKAQSEQSFFYIFLEMGHVDGIEFFRQRRAPFFFILDQDRVVRKVIQGYGIEKTDKEITDAIKALL